MRKEGRIAFAVCLTIFLSSLVGCDPFSSKHIPEDISGTWGGSITEGTGYYNLTLRLSQSGTLVTGSWTSAIRGRQETGGINGSYFDGKAKFNMSVGSTIIGNMELRFEDDSATGSGSETGKQFTIVIKEL